MIDGFVQVLQPLYNPCEDLTLISTMTTEPTSRQFVGKIS
jgi:hypothetical protein